VLAIVDQTHLSRSWKDSTTGSTLGWFVLALFDMPLDPALTYLAQQDGRGTDGQLHDRASSEKLRRCALVRCSARH
jgi:hypothetical protein